MTDSHNLVNQVIDEQHREKPAATRRQMIGATTGLLAGFGLLSTPSAMAQLSGPNYDGPNTPENILNVAATAEVLATIVNTVGLEQVQLDDVTRRNVAAAAREELIHYEVLRSVGGREATKRIWVPDSVFESRFNFLITLAVGDQIFINAYLLGTTVFARPGGSGNARLARFAAEFMGAEAVHRALALQSLGRLGNDRAFMKFDDEEETPALPTTGRRGFTDIRDAAEQLTAAGFGLGTEGDSPGRFYDFDEVSRRTPDPQQVHTRAPD